MPQEINRVASVRRVTNPDDSSVYVDVLVIDEITFIDPKDNYQQTTWTFDNSNASSRQAHAVTVTGSDGGSKIKVERIDQYSVIDPKDRHQETRTTLDNSSEARFAVDYAPPSTDDRVTHDVKIYSKDGGAWVKVRRTDSFKVKDPKDHYQETIFKLDNKDTDAGNPAPTNLPPPTTTWDGTTINPPWRLDPFQNIVDVSWSRCLFVMYGGNSVAAFPMANLAGIRAQDVIYRKTLAASDWTSKIAANGNSLQNDAMMATQLKLSTAFAAICATFKIISAPSFGPGALKIVADGNYSCCDALNFGMSWTDSANIGHFAGAVVVSGVNMAPATPAINGDANTIYFAGEKFARDPISRVLTKTGAAPTVTSGSTVSQAVPTLVSSQGALYWGANVSAGSIGISSFSGASYTDAQESALNVITVPTTCSPVTAPYTTSYYPQTCSGSWGSALCGGPGPNAAQAQVGAASISREWLYSAIYYEQDNDSASFSLSPANWYISQVGGIDVVAVAFNTLSLSSSYQYTYDIRSPYSYFNPYIVTTETSAGSYMGIAVSNSGDLTLGMVQWPYPLSNAAAGQFYQTSVISGADTLHTPYFTLGPAQWVAGWLHVSNGAHIAQGFEYSSGGATSRRLFLDGSDWETALSAAVGVPLANIDCVLFDIPLEAIQHLV